MKNKSYPALLAIAALFVCTTARATLIGDTLTLSLQSPLGIPSFTTSTVVQAGVGDVRNLNGLLVANPEASSFNLFSLSTTPTILFPNTGVFNGVVVTGITDTIASITITTNVLAGWDNSRLTFDDHSFSVDFRGLIFPPSGETGGFSDLTVCAWCIEITPRPANSPDSGSSAVLLAIGALGLAAVSRRYGRKN